AKKMSATTHQLKLEEDDKQQRRVRLREEQNKSSAPHRCDQQRPAGKVIHSKPQIAVGERTRRAEPVERIRRHSPKDEGDRDERGNGTGEEQRNLARHGEEFIRFATMLRQSCR